MVVHCSLVAIVEVSNCSCIDFQSKLAPMEGNLRLKLALLLVAGGLSVAGAQPLGCTEDYHCVVGYCDKETQNCRACLNCEDFKRSPPLAPTKCITSVLECGACFEGLVEDVQGGVNAQCAARDAVPSAYVWVAIALAGLLLFVAAVAIVVYVLRNTDTFRILASAGTSVQSGCGAGPTATAPELPPAYNSLYSPVRPESPAAPPPPHSTDEEAASPFIKRPPPAPAREAAGSQAANYYNNPNYVRGPHLPSSQQTAESDPEPEYLHEENTAESLWTPTDTANNNASGESSECLGGGGGGAAPKESGGAGASGPAPLAAQLAAARATTLVRPPCQDVAPPAKLPRLRHQDTNNNRNNQERTDGEAMSRPASGPTFNILVNVQQRNDLKL